MSHEDGGTSWCDSCVGKVVKLTFHYSSPKCIVMGYFSVKEDSNFQTVAPECDFFVIAMSFSVVFFLFSFSCPKTVSFRKPCLAEIFVTCDLLNNAHMVRFLGNISVLIRTHSGHCFTCVPMVSVRFWHFLFHLWSGLSLHLSQFIVFIWKAANR